MPYKPQAQAYASAVEAGTIDIITRATVERSRALLRLGSETSFWTE